MGSHSKLPAIKSAAVHPMWAGHPLQKRYRQKSAGTSRASNFLVYRNGIECPDFREAIVNLVGYSARGPGSSALLSSVEGGDAPTAVLV